MSQAVLSSIVVAKDSENRQESQHAHRRMFVGPMPEKVISQTEAQVKKRRRIRFIHDEADEAPQLIHEHAFRLFLQQGGNLEDWGENEQGVREELLRRWRESEWGSLWSRRQNKANKATSRWVGGSFEVGQLLGVNLMQGAFDGQPLEGSSQYALSATSHGHGPFDGATSTTGHETFTTARTGAMASSLHLPHNFIPAAVDGNGNSGDTEGQTPPNESIHSGTALLHLEAQSEIIPYGPRNLRPILQQASTVPLGNANGAMLGKGPARFIHYEDEAVAGDEDVVPPAEVLERTGSAVDGTSAGAAVSDGGSSVGLNWGDIVLRDRMLVRVSYSKTEITGKHFDETIHRTTRNLRYEDWAEFMVVWRKDRIELYEDYNMPGKEWITGHKHLSFVILLKSTKTRLSIYSFVDMTFCITAPPTNPRRTTSGSHSIFHREKEGTNIFVFKTKSRTRAYDWTWHLWRHLGGIIPRNIEICNPALNTKVRIDIPEVDSAKGDEALSVFNRENVIELCTEALRSVGNWKTVIERQIDNGKNLELAWRVGSHVDWIWLSDDTEGRPRKWAVLCGLVLRESMKSAALEIRLAEHFPNSIHLKDGNRLLEPPAIEGYLERIKPNTQMKQSLYLSTHDGNLFTLSPAAAHPPDPPGLLPVHTDSPGKCLREAERIRGTKQIMGAFGVSDLRSILLVRRAFHLAPQRSHGEKAGPQENDIWFGIWSQSEDRTQSDDEDGGGEEGLAKSQDKPRLKMKRSFELLLTTGHVVRFEAHSRRLAVEWIERLRALVVYWKQRHRLDAREEMDLAQARRPRLTPHTHVFLNDGNLPPETPADAAAPLPALGTLYNWCVLDGCKSILRGGKVYTRQGLRGQYKLVQLFLIPGYLVQFRINPGSSLHSSVKRKISLIDAYVCSGYFAALALPRGQYNPSAGAAPRRYQDGLEADDPEEDMLFMVWYRPHTPVAQSTESSIPKTVPALSAKRKLSIFRTRSKLERDAWCWALNSEIERMVRAEKDRENILRTTGKLPDI